MPASSVGRAPVRLVTYGRSQVRVLYGLHNFIFLLVILVIADVITTTEK